MKKTIYISLLLCGILHFSAHSASNEAFATTEATEQALSASVDCADTDDTECASSDMTIIDCEANPDVPECLDTDFIDCEANPDAAACLGPDLINCEAEPNAPECEETPIMSEQQ